MKRINLCIAVLVVLFASAAFAKTADKHPKKIGMAAAKKIALAKEPGRLKSAEQEKEHGKQIYSFDIKAKDGIHEVNVDAYTGEVLEDKIETAADEAKEKAADKAAKKKH